MSLSISIGLDERWSLACRTLLSENGAVRGRDFIQSVSELWRERNVTVRVDAKRGKGSHVTLYY